MRYKRLSRDLILVSSLRKSRKKLIERFVNEAPDLYADIFRSSTSSSRAEVYIKRHFVLWQSEHFSILQEIMESVEQKEEEKQEVVVHMARLLARMSEALGMSISRESQASFVALVLGERKELLDMILSCEERSERGMNRLQYLFEKERAAFSILMKSLEHDTTET